MIFEEAMTKMRAGSFVRRAQWPAKDFLLIRIVHTQKNSARLALFYLIAAHDELVAYNPQHVSSDLLADDWEERA